MSASSPTDTTQPWLACPECQAPLEATQRYCVSCGARQLGADNPAARYFGAAAQRRRAPVALPPRRGVGIGLAALLALLPLLVGVGVLVGRAGHDNSSLVSALRNQRPTVVNVGGGGTGASGNELARTTGNSAASKSAKGSKASVAASNTVVATGVGGAAHSVLHHTSTASSRAKDKQQVRNLTKKTGKNYIQSQKTLPDVVDVQSDPGAGGTAPTGAGD